MTSIEQWTPDAGRAEQPALSRLVAPARAVRRWTLRLATTAAAAGAVIVYALTRDGFSTGGRAVLAVIAIVAIVAPPVLLAAFFIALTELMKLPERVRRVPLESREHGEQLRRLFDRVREARGSRFEIFKLLWRLTRVAGSARETLTPYAPLLPLLSVPFLAAVALAIPAAVLEVVVACVVGVVLAF